ncbi:MAG: hypothetical protein AAF492_23335, partial [Verrucomicrobiota bacterium]
MDGAYGHSVGVPDARIGNHYWFGGFQPPVTNSGQATMALSTWDGDGGSPGNGLDSWWINSTFAGADDRPPLATGTDQLRIGSRIDGPTEGILGHIAEILVYDRALTGLEQDEVGEYLSIKYGLRTSYGSGRIANGAATNIFPTTAEVTASLIGSGSVFEVFLYYGPTDGGTNPSTWGNTVSLGSYTNLTTHLGRTLTGLPPGTNTYYTFRATNCMQDLWAVPSGTFSTPAQQPPVVGTANGAVATLNEATLEAQLVQGELAELVVYWGIRDGGTNKSAWQHVVPLGQQTNGLFRTALSDLLSCVTYSYRVYASNGAGEAWSPGSVPFTVGLPTPSDLTQLAVWLDASDPTTLWQDTNGTLSATSEGDPIRRWDDKSGHNRHMLDLTGAVPTLAAGVSALNGTTALYFEDDQLGRPNDTGIMGNGDRTVISVWANAVPTGQNFEHTVHFGTTVSDGAYGHSV